MIFPVRAGVEPFRAGLQGKPPPDLTKMLCQLPHPFTFFIYGEGKRVRFYFVPAGLGTQLFSLLWMRPELRVFIGI